MTTTAHNWLQQDVTILKGIGPSVKSNLAKLNISTIQDCLFHLPRLYQDRTHIHPIRTLRPGDYAVIEANVVNAQVMFGRKRMLKVHLHDGTGELHLRFFHFNQSQKDKFIPGMRVRAFGEARLVGRQLEMVHPEYTVGREDSMPDMQETMTPIYPLTDGMTQHTLRKFIHVALQYLETQDLPELLPDDIISKHHFPSLKESILFCHNPPPDASIELLSNHQHPAQQRLIFEELCAHHLSLIKLRKAKQRLQTAVCENKTLCEALLARVGFTLTGAQQRVLNDIFKDMRQTHPMLRLLQGDVGSGKTVVAAAAMAQAIDSGYQAALMAPTEILAEQHYQNFINWFEPLGVNIAWLTGKLTAKEKRLAYEKIASGEAQLIIGTHALVQEAVSYHNLGLVIIDEQHRFGVHQRLALAAKGQAGNFIPHQLIMTATPIPRTLAMTAYADLDYSVIDELPPGRTPVTTAVMSNDKREMIVERIRDACKNGKQAYWVCTLIEQSETLTAEAAEICCEQLQELMPDVNIGLVHGKLKPQEKEAVMQQFAHNQLQLLVATTVIEVGVNVPNASLMIIENPERLGLSQLHQLRGRVGRGDTQSHCVLLYHPPLSHTARERLNIMRETNDGFLIADKDLQIRGPGEWLGTRQTGSMTLRIADIVRDKKLIPEIKPSAESLMQTYPEKIEPLLTRWLGLNIQYAQV